MALSTPFVTFGSIDSSISRINPASLAIGNGNVGDSSGMLTLGSVQIGPNSNAGYLDLAATPFIYAENTNTNTTGNSRNSFNLPYSFNTFLNPTTTSAVEVFTINGLVDVLPSCAQSFSNELCGIHGEGDHNGTGAALHLFGISGEAYNLNTGSAEFLYAVNGNSGTLGDHGPVFAVYGVNAALYLQGVGTITNAYAMHIGSPVTGNGAGTGPSVVTNYAQLYIELPGTPATTNWGIYCAGGDNYLGVSTNAYTYVARILSNDQGQTAPSFSFNSEPGLGLYRPAINELGIAIKGTTTTIFDYAFGTTILGQGDMGFCPGTLGTRDLNIHRVSAATLGVGNGTYADTSGTFQGNLRTGAGSGVVFLTDVSFGVSLYNSAAIRFSAANTIGSGDVSISRLASGSLAIGNGTTGNTSGKLSLAHINLNSLVVYTSNAAAIAGGLVAGDTYRTGTDPDVVCIVH
jgi:hypothetical protein